MIKRFNKMSRGQQTMFAIVIAFAVVAFWRGVWGLMDEFLFPNNYALSSFISLAIGLAVLFVTEYATKELM